MAKSTTNEAKQVKASPRRKSTRRKASEPAVDVSALKRAVLLLVDPARRSGWCVTCPDGFECGETDVIKEPTGPDAVCNMAIMKASRLGVPCLLSLERPFRGTTQGTEYGTWRNAFLRMGGQANKVQGVYPSTWRSKSLGSKWVNAKRDDVKAEERRVAIRLTGRDVGPEAAAAVCMRDYAWQSVDLWKRLPKLFVTPRHHKRLPRRSKTASA